MGPRDVRMGYGEGFTMRNFIVYIAPNIVRIIKSCSQNGRSRSAFKILTGTPTVKRPLGRPRHRCEGNIRIDLKVIGINVRN